MTFSLFQKKNIHNQIFIFGVALMLIGMSLSTFLMSISQFILALNLMWEGNLKTKWKIFISNKPAVVLSSLFVLHLIGLTYTSDFDVALKDLKIKLPILILPFIFINSKPIEKSTFRFLFFIFIASIVISTFWGIAYMLGITHKEITDIRDISRFISHIRLSLMICLSIFFLLYWIYNNEIQHIGWKIFSIAVIGWLLFFLILLESVTGISLLIIISIFLLTLSIFRIKKLKIKIVALLGLIVLIASTTYFIYNEINSFYVERNCAKEIIKKQTIRGNLYTHDFKNNQIENTTYIWRNIEWDELKSNWNKRSKIPFDSLDKKKQGIRYAVIRFLSSKGLDKDSVGVWSLSPKEVEAIEDGVCNYKYLRKFSIRPRIHKIIWEYESYKQIKNPSGHSVTLKLEFWKTSLFIIRHNLFFGVGTGDIDNAFMDAYKITKSPLSKEYQLKSHNQYLRITVLFGLFGLTWFLVVLFYPLFALRKFDYYYSVFFLILIISMITEDTIETQAGVSFYAFIGGLIYFINRKD